MNPFPPLACPICKPTSILGEKSRSFWVCPRCGFGSFSFNSAAYYFGEYVLHRSIALLEFKLSRPHLPCPDCRRPMLFTRPWASYVLKEKFGALSPRLEEWPPDLRERELGYCVPCSQFGAEKSTMDAGKILQIDPQPEPREPTWEDLADPPDLHQVASATVTPFRIEGVPEGSHPLFAAWFLGAACVVGNRLTSSLGSAWSYDSLRPTKHHGLNLITSLFLHAGAKHLIGNLFVLFLFASHLEPHLGARRFLELFFFSGIAGNLAMTFLSAEPMHAVGASGAISGIMAYLTLAFPKARWVKEVFVRRIPLRTATLSFPLLPIGFLWLGLQILHHLQPDGSRVAYLGHIGGALGGILYYGLTSSPKKSRPV